MEFFNDAGDDPLKPTLFELVAQEQLRALLQPALKYVLSVRPACFSPRKGGVMFCPAGLRAEVPPVPPSCCEPARGVLCTVDVLRGEALPSETWYVLREET